MGRTLRIVTAAVVTAALFATGWMVGRLVAPTKFAPLKCYTIKDGTAPNAQVLVQSRQFGGGQVKVMEAEFFCGPVDKALLGDRKPAPVARGDHLQCYDIKSTVAPGKVVMSDQFGTEVRELGLGRYLCEPADKLRARTPEPPGS